MRSTYFIFEFYVMSLSTIILGLIGRSCGMYFKSKFPNWNPKSTTFLLKKHPGDNITREEIFRMFFND